MTKNPTLRKAEQELQKELIHQLHIFYPAATVILWNDYGWRAQRIFKIFNQSQTAWDECANWGTEKSMMMMLEEETGIELCIEGNKSYHDLAFLDAKKWDGHKPSVPEQVLIRKRQKKWIQPQLMACLLLSLHRDEKWGAQRLEQFLVKMDALRLENGENENAYETLLEYRTGLSMGEVMRGM